MGRRSGRAAEHPRPAILIDTSAWIEFLRDTKSPACVRVDKLLNEDIAISEPVRMEALAGARDERQLSDLRGLLAWATLIHTEAIDYEEAAVLYRVFRHSGETVRKLIDCLIASIAIRTGSSILHCDTDFDVLARHNALQIDRP